MAIGEPAEVVAAAAEAVDAGLIVLATSAHDPFGQALRRDLLRRATVPVLLADPEHVRPEPLRPRPPEPAPAPGLLRSRFGAALTP